MLLHETAEIKKKKKLNMFYALYKSQFYCIL